MPELNLDFSSVNEEDIPEGWHSGRFFSIKEGVSQNGNALLKVQVKIEGGPHAGRSLFDNWMLETDALFRTKQILNRLGLSSKGEKSASFNTDDLVGKEVEVRVKHQEYEGEVQPRIGGYRLPTGETLEAMA